MSNEQDTILGYTWSLSGDRSEIEVAAVQDVLDRRYQARVRSGQHRGPGEDARDPRVHTQDGRDVHEEPVELSVTFPKAGKLSYACSMDMVKGFIVVQ